MTRKGANGFSTNGVTAYLGFFDGTVWVIPLIYVYIPKSASAYLFPQSDKIIDFCSGPISVDPICPQPHDVIIGVDMAMAPAMAMATATAMAMAILRRDAIHVRYISRYAMARFDTTGSDRAQK